MRYLPTAFFIGGCLAWALGAPLAAVWGALACWAAVCALLKIRHRDWSLRRLALGPLADLAAWRGGALFYAVLAAALAAWVAIRLRQWNSFGFSLWTLSVYTNVVSNSLRGHLLYASVFRINHLGTHFSPIMLAFVPFYALAGDEPRVLMLAQVLTTFAAAWLLLVYARQVLGNTARAAAIGAAVALAFLIYDPMMNAVLNDFHPSTLAPPLILWGLLALRRGRRWQLACAAAALLCLKESGALIVASLALYAWLVAGRRREGAVLAAAAVLLPAVYFGWVVPHFNPEPWHQASRVQAASFLAWPANRMRLVYLLRLLLPFLFLPLLDWRMMLVAAPNLLLNLITQYEPQLSAQSHYDDAVAPLLAVALIHVLGRLGGAEIADCQNSFQGKNRIGGQGKWLGRAAAAALLALLWTPLLASKSAPLALFKHYRPGDRHAQLRRRARRYAALPFAQPVIAPGRLAPLVCAHALVSHRQTELGPEDFAPGNILLLTPVLDTRVENTFRASRPLIEKNLDRLETLEHDNILWAFRVLR